ncbi:VWA domain-containing protein [Thiocystis violacea]|uniref:VWA domain-containing protein n=1 Tax=Thiocystis violacea TaxID=13725 RepID=UPI0019048595
MPSNPVSARLILGLLLMLSWGLPAAAVDVVLALDRSLSMNANDPNRHSLKGAELFGELLGQDDRLSLTTFAQDAPSLMPLTPLSDRQALERILGLIRGISMDGTRTDFTAALRLAYRHHSASGGDRDAKRILVLFTDGQLNLGNEEATQTARATIIDELVPQFQEAGIQIYGIAFSPEADLGFLRLLTDTTGGRAFRAERPEDIYLAFLKLFEQADLPLTTAVIDGAVEVDANVRELKLLVQRGVNDAPTTLMDPSQHELVAGDQRPGVDWRSTANFDHITIQQPEAGSWKITADSQDKRAYIESDLDLEATIPLLANVDEAVAIAAKLTYRGGDVEARLSGNTRFTATVLDESGAVQQEVELQPDAGQQPLQDHRGVLRFPAPGSFQIRVSAEGEGFERAKTYSISLLRAQPMPGGADDTETRRSALALLMLGNLVLAALLGIGIGLWWWRRNRRKDCDDFTEDT